ncbi:MAG: PilZ domain-containing protein [Acidobacteriota bacterium]|nr:MAG: PilZ domain-containing protein [Acidobacteriota bacterium]
MSTRTTGSTTNSTDSTRRFARVEQTVPIRVRVIDEREAEQLVEQFRSESTYVETVAPETLPSTGTDVPWDRAALSSILSRIAQVERTLARIAEALNVDLSEGMFWLEGETSSLSGSGVGIVIPQRLDPETLLELELTLLGDPRATLRCLARVVSVVHPDGESLPVGRYHLGVAFEGMHEEDREALVRYTFRLQRAQLRERSSSIDED